MTLIACLARVLLAAEITRDAPALYQADIVEECRYPLASQTTESQTLIPARWRRMGAFGLEIDTMRAL
jgi:hypothetical protein